MQPADGNAVAANLHIRTGNLVVHHACVVYEQITRLDDDFFIMNQVFARTAANENQLDKILMRVHDTRMRTGIRSDFTDVKQLRLILALKN